ncbi:hypothetical protein [Ruegeria sp. THAF57]|uniref:hypothetical protein n=1 Tax=Ruegeria sp. THAF57 TaxID=2744555 RepID=UPI0015DE1486|nr:hypothetical protein [Ruegeria sp. THAF57]
MKSLVIQEMLKPLVHRIGTTVGAFVAGASSIADAHQVEAAIVLLLGLAVDMITRKALK